MNGMKDTKTVAKRKQTFMNRREYLHYNRPVIDIKLSDYIRQYCKLNLDVGNAWLNEHHPQGAGIGNRLIVGVIYKHIETHESFIGAAMAFKKSKDTEFNFELSRIWTLCDYDTAQNQFNDLSELATHLGVYNIVAYINTSFERVYWCKDIGMSVADDEPKYRKWGQIDGKYYSASSLLNKLKRGTIADLPKLYWDTGTVKVVCK